MTPRSTVARAVLAATSLLISCTAARAEGDAEAGRKIFQKCGACHRVEAGRNAIGPSLHGIVGRQAGRAEGFNYSVALKGASIVWTEDNLEKWLQRPQALVPGTKMTFPGLPSAKERADVIAFLQSLR